MPEARVPKPSAKGGAPLPRAVALARQLTAEQRPDEACSVLGAAATLAGERAAIHAEHARILERLRRYRPAEALWAHTLAAAPGDATAQHGRIRTLRHQQRYAEARRWIGEGLEAAPHSRTLLLERARLEAECEVYPAAASAYHALLGQQRQVASDLGELADVEVARHRFAAAQAILGELCRSDPGRSQWPAKLAEAAEAQGDVRAAGVHWRQVLHIDHRNLSARLALARLREAAGQVRRAEADLQDLAETHRHAVEPLLELARLALAQADHARALAWLRSAAARRPDPWLLDSRMARTLVAQGRFGPARKLAASLVARLPDHLDAHLLRAWVEELAGRPDRADAMLGETEAAFPQGFAASVRRAEALLRAGQPSRARDVAARVRALHPKSLSVRLIHADACFAAGDPREAEVAVEALHEDYPQHREVRRRLVRVEAGSGRYASARRVWAEVYRHDARVQGPPVHLERLDARPIPPAAGEVRLFTRLRNELLRLPWVLDYYRGQGVDRFFIVDNGSDDGTRDYLLGRPDTHLFLTTDSYAEYGGGVRWLNHLLHRHGSGTWCLTVDVDEVLAYPHAERIDLKALTAHLELQGAEALFTFMLDLYGDAALDRLAYRAGDDPLATCGLFDRAGYVHRDWNEFPYRMVVGGLVARYLYDRKQDGVFLHKVPLVRWREDLHYGSSTHTLGPVPLAAETGVLLHFKYMADFIDRARIESERKQYWQGAKRYTEFDRRFARTGVIDFRCDVTERFTSTDQLVALGLMRSSPALDALAAPLGDQPPLPGWRRAAP